MIARTGTSALDEAKAFADQLREAVTVKAVVEKIGLTYDGGKQRYRCPKCGPDKDGQLSVKDDGWYCHRCKVGGSIFDLAMLAGVASDFVEARNWIAAEFGLDGCRSTSTGRTGSNGHQTPAEPKKLYPFDDIGAATDVVFRKLGEPDGVVHIYSVDVDGFGEVGEIRAEVPDDSRPGSSKCKEARPYYRRHGEDTVYMNKPPLELVPLFGISESLRIGGDVIACEGPAVAAECHGKNIAAVSPLFGAAGARGADWAAMLEALPDRKIILSCDNDEAGKSQFGPAVFDAVVTKGGRELFELRIDDLPDGGDLRNYIALRSKVGESDADIRNDLLERMAAAPKYTPPAPPAKQKQQGKGKQGKPKGPPPPSEMDLARELLAERYTVNGVRTIRWWKDEPYLYDGRSYKVQPESEMVSGVMLWLDGRAEVCKHKRAQEVVRSVAAETTVAGRFDLPLWIPDDGPPQTSHLLAMANGLFDVESYLAGKGAGLQPHSARLFTVAGRSYPFDEDATCAQWQKFLHEALDGDVERISLLAQWFGLCLIYDVSHQRFMILHGDGGSGKSVCLEVLQAMLGAENCSHLPLELFGHPFQLWGTAGKLANLVSEVGDLARTDEGIFKAFVAGETLPMDRKYLPAVQARATARCTIACNALPRWKDRSDGIWRRQIVTPFNNVCPEERQDKHLAKRIINDELPGVFNWALAGLASLRRTGRFMVPEISRAASAEHRQDCNPARSYLLEHCEASPAGEIRADALYADYTKWSQDNGYTHPLGNANFGQEVRRLFANVDRKQRRVDNERPWFLIGLGWRDVQAE